MTNQLEIYQQLILEHNRNPRHFFEIKDPSHKAEGFNPLCGDHIWIYLSVRDDKTVERISFQGNSCAICKASASMMTSALEMKTIDEVSDICDTFVALLKGQASEEAQEALGKLKVFSSVWRFPARVKCAALAWHTLRGALADNKGAICTEA